MKTFKRETKILGASGILTATLLAIGTSASAAPTITSAIGGVPTGHPSIQYENFNGLTVGRTGGTTSTGIKVTFGRDGKVVTGSSGGLYAAPYLSGQNASLFGNSPATGKDTTKYLTSGATNSYSTANATLVFPKQEKYLGLLWGSVDKKNKLSFYNSATVFDSTTRIASYKGTAVNANASGNQGAMGTYYVNFNLATPFKSVVATSPTHAFEFDNVAFSPNDPSLVSEPGSLRLLALGLTLLGFGMWRRKRQ